MPHIPPQSEPVDPKELCRRLEVLLQQQQQRERKARASLPASQLGNSDCVRVDCLDLSNPYRAPPPPTALPTRPQSFMPYQAPPSQIQLPPQPSLPIRQPLSQSSVPRSTARHTLQPDSLLNHAISSHLDQVSHTGRLGAQTSSRPSTSWNAERRSRLLSREEEEDGSDTALKISRPAARPKSMSNLSRSSPQLAVASSKRIDHDSSKELRLVPQPVQIVSPQKPLPQIAPISAVPYDPQSPTLGLPPQTPSVDTSSFSASGLSSATTIVQAHSASSSKSDRRSWNPRNLLSKLKDKHTAPSSSVIPLPTQPVVPPLREIPVDPIPTFQSTTALPNQPLPSWEKPIPRPHTMGFEPFSISDHRFSGISDLSSTRISESHSQFRLSDIDSGLGLSDSTSTNGADEIPVLKSGAEKRPDWNKVDHSIRHRKLIENVTQPYVGTESGTALKRNRESTLRNEVSVVDAFDFDSSVVLQDEPPEDEGVYIEHSLQSLSEVDRSQSLRQSRSVPDFVGVPSLDRKNSHTRHIAADDNPYSTADNDAPPARHANRYTLSHATATCLPPSRTQRPSSRAQPILTQQEQLDAKVNRLEPGPSPPRSVTKPVYQRYSSGASSKAHSKRPSESRAKNLDVDIPPVPPPPKVPQDEIAHMTPQSIAFLRQQERLLIRRSTLRLGYATTRAFDDQGEIGVAISPGPQTSHIEPSPRYDAAPEPTIATGPYGMKYCGQDTSSMGKASSHSASTNVQSKNTTATATPRANSVNFPRMPGSKNTFNPVPPKGAVSMVDLGKSRKERPAVVADECRPEKKKKKHWWKVWRLV